MILSKVDLAPHLRFDADRAVVNALSVNPRQRVFALSAESGEGVPEWYDWLRSGLTAAATHQHAARGS
jgi:hydrogenase nickel incorporation protein HypB